MNTRTLFALAVLAAALIVVAPSARAQLPPSPSDTPPGERPGVRPTPAPRTPPPPPPDGNPRPAPRPASPRGRVAPSPPVVPPPPPPDATPTTPPPAPAAPTDKVFGTRGVLELGGSLDFSVQLDIDPESSSKATWFDLGLDVYAGYFVAKYFTLGLYLSVYFEQVKISGASSWRVTPGFLAAPGVAVRLVPRVFFYGDLLAGLFGQKQELNDLTASRNTNVYGAVGAEAGIKLRLARRFLLRLGVRPIIFVGKSKTTTASSSFDSKIRWFTFMLRIGISGFL